MFRQSGAQIVSDARVEALGVADALQDVDVLHMEPASAEAPARQPSHAEILALPSHSSPIVKVDPLQCQIGERRLVRLGKVELPTRSLGKQRADLMGFGDFGLCYIFQSLYDPRP